MVITTRTRPDRNAAPVEVSIRDYLNTFFYYRRIAVTVFLSIVALGIAVALVVPMPYRAQATLLVLLAGYYEQSNSVGGAAVQPALGQLNSVEAQILGSPELHRDVVVSELGPSASEREIAHRLQDFEKRLHIAQNDVANTITLTYSDSNPVAAADQLKHLLAQYFKRRAAIFTSGRVAFLTGQRDEVGAQLKKANDDLLAFEQTHGIVNLDDQMASAITLTGQLVQQKLENDTKLAQNRAELKSVQGSSQGVSATIPLFTDDSEGAHALGTMQVELMQLEAKRADFASRYLPTSPFVAQLDKQIADTRAAIAKQNKQAATATRMGHNTYYDTVQARLADLNANIAGEAAQQQVLDQQIKDARTNQQRLSDIASQFRQLQAARDILGDSFKERSRAVELATIQEGQASQANSTNVRVIQAPFPPSERVVSGGMIIEAAIAAGLVIAGLVVLILASLRETFLSPEQVERSLLLPVLNAPVAVGGGPARRAAMFGAAAADGARPGPRPRQMDYGRMIAAINTSTDARSKVVMALSFAENDSLSAVIWGLAGELAYRAATPVLILDLASTQAPVYDASGAPEALARDARRDAAAFKVPEAAGASGLAFEPLPRHNLVIARPAGGSLPSSWEQTEQLFNSLRQAYDYVIVHAPPASQSFAGIENASLADATVLAVRAEVTRKPVILALAEQVRDAGGNLIGVVLTHRRGYIPQFIYRFF